MTTTRTWPAVRVCGAGPRDVLRVIGVVACAVATVWIVGAMLVYARSGLDLTDEGYYLNWIAHPGQYEASATQFGFVYHPLYRVLGGDLVLLRQANILIMFTLGWTAAWLAATRVLGASPRSITAAVASAAVACTTLLGFHVSLVTPSYNSLVLCGLLVVVIGLLLDAGRGAAEVRRLPWILVGLGGTGLFLGKPTAAVSVGVVVLLYLVIAGRLRSSRLLWAAGTGLVLVLAFALIVDHSLVAFVDRLTVGAERLSLLGAGHETGEVMRWDRLEVEGPFRDAMVGAVLVIALGTAIFACRSRLGSLLSTVAFVAVAVWWWRMTEQEPEVFADRELNPRSLLIAAPLGVALVVAALAGRARLAAVGRARWALAGCLIVLPHASGIGSNLHYWQQAGMAAIVWVVAAMVLLVPFAGRLWVPGALLPVALMSQVLTYGLVHPALEYPYRQAQSVFEFTAQVEVGRAGSTVSVTDAAAPFLRETRRIFAEQGLDDGHPVIDLTGQSPGVIWAGGAMAVDHPWVIGGYDGSDEHERAALAALECTQAVDSWVLIEEDGPRTIDPAVLTAFGADWREDYAEAARWPAPQIGRRPWDVERGTLVLWEPTRSSSEAVDACEQAREENR